MTPSGRPARAPRGVRRGDVPGCSPDPEPGLGRAIRVPCEVRLRHDRAASVVRSKIRQSRGSGSRVRWSDSAQCVRRALSHLKSPPPTTEVPSQYAYRRHSVRAEPATAPSSDIGQPEESRPITPAAPRARYISEMPILSLRDVVKDYVSEGQPVRALDGVSLSWTRARSSPSSAGAAAASPRCSTWPAPWTSRRPARWRSTACRRRPRRCRLTALRREKVGFVFQSFQLLHTLTVVENVELPLLLAGGRDVRGGRSSASNGWSWEDWRADLPHQLSGGQMQRVAIARALANDPGCCWPTSRPATSIRPPAATSSNCSDASTATAARRR